MSITVSPPKKKCQLCDTRIEELSIPEINIIKCTIRYFKARKYVHYPIMVFGGVKWRLKDRFWRSVDGFWKFGKDPTLKITAHHIHIEPYLPYTDIVETTFHELMHGTQSEFDSHYNENYNKYRKQYHTWKFWQHKNARHNPYEVYAEQTAQSLTTGFLKEHPSGEEFEYKYPYHNIGRSAIPWIVAGCVWLFDAILGLWMHNFTIGIYFLICGSYWGFGIGCMEKARRIIKNYHEEQLQHDILDAYL